MLLKSEFEWTNNLMTKRLRFIYDKTPAGIAYTILKLRVVSALFCISLL